MRVQKPIHLMAGSFQNSKWNIQEKKIFQNFTTHNVVEGRGEHINKVKLLIKAETVICSLV